MNIASKLRIALNDCKRKNHSTVMITVPVLETLIDEFQRQEESKKLLKIIKSKLVLKGNKDFFDGEISMEPISQTEPYNYSKLLDFMFEDEPVLVNNITSNNKEVALSVVSFHHCPRCGANVTDEMACDKYYCGNCGGKLKYDKQ